MQKHHIILLAGLTLSLLTACTKRLDTKVDTSLTEKNVSSDYTQVWGFGYTAYSFLKNGFNSLDGNLFAAVSDEADQTETSPGSQLFNQGSWNAFNNPNDVYGNDYAGIRAANYFLENSTDYKNLLLKNRDTLSDNGRQYHLDVQDVSWLRSENRVLRAYFYFDLIKRYGGVPLVTHVLKLTDNLNLPANSFDDIANFIVSEIDAVKDSLQSDWKNFDDSKDGRLTLGAALAIKSRVLLYAASPLHNPGNDPVKWQMAASAALEVMNLNQYSLDNDYQNLFLEDHSTLSPETIWAIRLGPSNDLEKKNYPVGTPGGLSGIMPSQNLVSAYEYKGTPDPADPYANRDPRLYYSIVINNSNWNDRSIEIWSGGRDDAHQANASRTGYYLKKFLSSNLNLVQNESKLRSWIVFRYAEVLLNYAEAMNEVYGPDNDNGNGLSARQAVNEVRNRTGVEMPPVTAGTQEEMRSAIKNERRIELAFEDHRYWDLLRWKDAEHVLNQPITGISATKNPDNSFTYQEFSVENRVFLSPQMYYYPIPQSEISKSNGILQQNPGW